VEVGKGLGLDRKGKGREKESMREEGRGGSGRERMGRDLPSRTGKVKRWQPYMLRLVCGSAFSLHRLNVRLINYIQCTLRMVNGGPSTWRLWRNYYRRRVRRNAKLQTCST